MGVPNPGSTLQRNPEFDDKAQYGGSGVTNGNGVKAEKGEMRLRAAYFSETLPPLSPYTSRCLLPASPALKSRRGSGRCSQAP